MFNDMVDDTKSWGRFYTLEEKVTIKEHLAKVEYLSPIAGCQCICCKNVALSHKIAPCKHVFCYECIKKLQNSQNSVCPEDDEDVRFDCMQQNSELERMVYCIWITCPNKTVGCEKQLTIGTLLEHLNECKYDNKRLLPTLYVEKNISPQVEQEEMVSMAVVNELRLKIKQLENQIERLENSFKTIPVSLETKLNTKFSTIESKIESTNRNNVDRIDDIKIALRRVSISSNNSPVAVQSLADQQNINILEKSLKTLQLASHGQYIWKVVDYISKKRSAVNQPDRIECSDSFYTHRYGHNVQAFLYMNGYGNHAGSHLAVGLRTIPGEWDGLLPRTLLQRCTFELLQQQENRGKRQSQSTEATRRHIRYLEEPHFLSANDSNSDEDNWGTSTFAPHKLIEAPRSSYIRNNNLFVRITVEPLDKLEWPIGTVMDGTISWTVSDYKQKKQDEIDGVCECQYSDYFYTSSQGYRMRLQLFLNGALEAKGTHLSIFLGVLKGNYDAQLPDAFRHKVVYRLQDARDVKKFSSKKHLVAEDLSTNEQDVASRMSEYRGITKLVAHSDLESPTSHYMKQNTICIEVAVVPLP